MVFEPWRVYSAYIFDEMLDRAIKRQIAGDIYHLILCVLVVTVLAFLGRSKKGMLRFLGHFPLTEKRIKRKYELWRNDF